MLNKTPPSKAERGDVPKINQIDTSIIKKE